MADTLTLGQQIQEQRVVVAQKRDEASAVQSELKQMQSRLPQTRSQESLRQRFAGLQGRNQRRVIDNAREEVSSQVDKIEVYKTELEDYERGVLNPSAQQLQQIQNQEAEAYQEEVAYNQAKKLYNQNQPSSSTSGRVKYYLREFESERDPYAEVKAKLDEVNTGATTLDQAFPKNKLEALQRSGVIRNQQVQSIPEFTPSGQLQSIIPELNREEKNKIKSVKSDFLTGLSVSSFDSGVVSAQSLPTQQYQTLIPKEQYQTLAPKSMYVNKEIPALNDARINPATGKPFGTVTPVVYDPLYDVKRIKELNKEVGMFKAVPAFVGETLERGVYRVLSGKYSPFNEYESRSISKLGNIGGQAGTYANALGVGLMIGGGVESFVTPAGRARITAQELSYVKSGSNKVEAKAFSYGVPVLEIGLGVYGLKGTRFDVNKPSVRSEIIPVDVKYAEGVGVTGRGKQLNVRYDSLTGQQVIVESGIPSAYIRDVGVAGRKTIITTPLRDTLGLKPLYDSSQVGRLNPKQLPDMFGRNLQLPSSYAKTKTLLISRGYTESQAAQVLRNIRPKYIRVSGKGEMAVVTKGDNQPLRLFAGSEDTIYLQGSKGGTNFLQRKPINKKIAEEASYLSEGKAPIVNTDTIKLKGNKPVVEGSKESFDIIGFNRVEGQASKPIGKQTETFKGVVGVKAEGEVSQAIALDDLYGSQRFVVQPGDTTFSKFSTAEISKKIVPKGRDLLTGEGRAYIQKGEPTVIITDGTIVGSKGFMGGGSKSSEQFLKDLYATNTQAKAETILSLIKTKPIKNPSPAKTQPSSQTTSSIPGVSLAGATGLNILGDVNSNDNSIPIRSSIRVDNRPSSSGASDFFSDFQAGFSSQTPTAKPTQAFGDLSASSGRQDVQVGQSQNQANRVDLRVETQSRSQFKQLFDLGVRAQSKSISIVKANQDVKVEQVLGLKVNQATKQEQQLAQQTRQVTRQRSTSRTRDKPNPGLRPPKIPSIPGSENSFGKTPATDLIKVFVRRKKQDELLGSFGNQGAAEKAFEKEVKGTLRASGFFTRNNEKIRVNLEGFESSRKDPFRLVEPRRRRLKRGSGETSEIQFFRKQKRKGGF